MNILLTLLLAASLVLLQCLIGGTRLVFSYPSYAIVGAAAVLSFFAIRRPIARPSSLCILSTLLLAGYVLCRAALSPVAYLARADLFMAAAALLVYLITVLYLNESRHRLWIVAALLAVAVAHTVVGLVQFREENGFMLFGFLRGETDWRASGMLICGNHLAGYLEALALFALSLTVWSRCRIGTKMLTAYLAAFCYLGLALTGSRGGYLSAAGSILVFGGLTAWIISIYRRHSLSLALAGILAAGALLVGTMWMGMSQSQVLQKRMQKIAQSSKDVRVSNWLATLDQFQLAPVWGTGAGTHLYYGRLFRRPEIQADPIHSHGDYLELLAEYGIIGEILAVGFLIIHVRNGVRNIGALARHRLCNALSSACSDSLALTVGAVAAVAALIAHSVVDFNMHIPANALVFAFFFGILANPGMERPKPIAPWPSPLMLLRGAVALAGIALLAGISARYRAEQWNEKARVALRNKDYQQCIARATLSIKADPTNPTSYFFLGEGHRVTALTMRIPPLRAVFFERAIAAYRKGLELFPQDENLLVRLGQALDGVRRFEEAGKAYTTAISLDPNLGLLHAYYSAHLQLVGNKEAAQWYLGNARSLGTKEAHNLGMAEVQSILDTDPGNLP